MDDDVIAFTNEVSAQYEDLQGHPIIIRPTSEYIPFRCTLARQVTGPISNVYQSLPRSQMARAAAPVRPPKPFLEGTIQLQTG